MVEESIAKNNFTHVSQTKPPWAKYYLLYGSQLLNVKIEKFRTFALQYSLKESHSESMDRI